MIDSLLQELEIYKEQTLTMSKKMLKQKISLHNLTNLHKKLFNKAPIIADKFNWKIATQPSEDETHHNDLIYLFVSLKQTINIVALSRKEANNKTTANYVKAITAYILQKPRPTK